MSETKLCEECDQLALKTDGKGRWLCAHHLGYRPMIKPEAPIMRKFVKPERNALCFCGSGKKFKNCCMNKFKQTYVYAKKNNKGEV